MGYVGRMIAEWCSQNGITYTFCDGNAEQKRKETNQEVIAPEKLPMHYPDAMIVVASINHYHEIMELLEQLGVEDSRILSYLEFWPEHVGWDELEESADWEAVRRRAEIFAAWIDPSAGSVADYSCEKNFLRDFLPKHMCYESPEYIRFKDNVPYGEFSGIAPAFRVDVSSCLAMLMSFSNPEAVIEQMCASTEKAVIASYVPLESMPDIRLRRSINYNNDFTEQELLTLFAERGFALARKAQDPFDVVHMVYLFVKTRGGVSFVNSSRKSRRT